MGRGRMLLAVLGLALCMGSHVWVTDQSVDECAAPLAAALGPLRPLVAEMRLLLLQERIEQQRYQATLDDALTVVALRPDSAALWIQIAYRLCFDLPDYESDPERRAAWFALGLEFRDRMVQRFEDEPEVLRAAATCSFTWLTWEPEVFSRLGSSPDLAMRDALRYAGRALQTARTEKERTRGRSLHRALLGVVVNDPSAFSPELRAHVVDEIRRSYPELLESEDGPER